MKKRYLALIGALAFIIVSLVVAQSAYYWTVVVRTYLDVRGKAVVTDSLRVQGTTKLVGAVTINGAQTINGLTTVDSLANGGNTRFGGLVDYLSRLSVKNGLILNAISVFNSRASAIFKVDSSGGIVGARGVLADTGAFSTTLTTKAVYISGATPSDIYVVSHRIAQGVSTAAMPDTTVLGYMAKTDSLIVTRSSGNISGTKFSWLRIR